MFWLTTLLMTHNTVWSIWLAGVGLENGFSEVWWAPVCHSLGDGLVLKAIMACLTKKYRYLWPMCFLFSSVPFFLVLHVSSMLPVCSMM